MFSQRNRELHAAIYVGDLAGVIKCLDRGPKRERAKADQADCYGCLPLIKAAGNDYKYYTDYTACRICSALLDRGAAVDQRWNCLLYTSPSPRDATLSRMPSSA